jgi:hypothetical protein
MDKEILCDEGSFNSFEPSIYKWNVETDLTLPLAECHKVSNRVVNQSINQSINRQVQQMC